MVRGNTRARTGLSAFSLICSLIAWVSAVIVMGIAAYLVAQDRRGDNTIYILVIAVLTTLFYPIAFFLRAFPGYVLLFNLIFSYLWIVAVTFTASSWIQSDDNLLLAATAFSFIAFFFLFFNVLYAWNHGFNRGGVHNRAVV